MINIYETKLDINKELDNLELSYGLVIDMKILILPFIKTNETGDTEFNSTRYPDNGSSDNTLSSYIHSELKIYKTVKWFNFNLRYDFQ